MRITFSNYDDLRNPYYGGGGARAIHEVARRLAARHEVRVLTGGYPGAEDGVVEGITYGRLGGARLGPRLGQLWYQARLPAAVRRGGYDVWVESLTPPFSTAMLPWLTPQPVVALTQVLAGRAMTRKYRLPFATLERWGLRAYRYAIALSSSIQAELLAANPRLETVVIPNGVGGDLIAQRVDRKEEHVLFLGRLDIEQKGLDLLLEAWRGVFAQVAAPLVLAGSGSASAEAWLRRRVAEFGLEKQVRWAGRVTGEAKHEVFRRATMMVMPSRFEASPLVLVEALCYGLPVVTFDLPELRDFPTSCCVKVPRFEVGRLGKAVADLAADTERRAAMGEAARAVARGYDWDDLAERYATFLGRCVAGETAASEG